MGPCGDGLCCAPVPAADQVEIHRKTLAAAMLVLPQIWHHLNISAQVVRRETHIAVVALIAPSPPMESKTCMCCKQKCTEYKWMNRFTPHSHAALYTHGRAKPFCVNYIHKARHNPLPWNVPRHAVGDAGDQAWCNATSARDSPEYASMCSNIVKSYAPYMKSDSKTNPCVGVHS